MGRIEIVRGDITEQDVDAIVNAANSGLAGGGGVDGAIHRSGGPEIMAECRRIGGCATGDAVITTGGRLKASHVIHAVGPVWADGDAAGCDALLASAYRRSLALAAQHGIRSVAFPSISTGAYRFPIERAAQVALRTIQGFLDEEAGSVELVRMVLFSPEDLAVYRAAAPAPS
jgi:O-acetyl-ADP-ribose deacetylase